MKVSIDKMHLYDRIELPLSDEEQGIMEHFVRVSDSIWVGRIDGRIACVWGLCPSSLLSQRAYLWLYNTELTSEHPFTFVRHAQRVVEVMLEEYEYLVGHTVIGHDHSIRWLKWLGAKFGEPEGKVIPFVIRRK